MLFAEETKEAPPDPRLQRVDVKFNQTQNGKAENSVKHFFPSGRKPRRQLLAPALLLAVLSSGF